MSKIQPTSETWYKARNANGKCRHCDNAGIYWMEVSSSWLQKNGMSFEKNYEDYSGNYCENHITEDMMEMIKNWDGGFKLHSYKNYDELKVELSEKNKENIDLFSELIWNKMVHENLIQFINNFYEKSLPKEAADRFKEYIKDNFSWKKGNE